MQRFLKSTQLREVLRPLGQMIVFSLGSSVVLSLIVIVLALLLDQTAVGANTLERFKVTLLNYTIVNLPQVLIDGLTLGFVYAAIALGYTMVYGVLEFINFAHSEIFAIGAFVGVEILIALEGRGILSKDMPVGSAYFWLIVALLAAMAAAGIMAVIVESWLIARCEALHAWYPSFRLLAFHFSCKT
jgi:branched-chain amino acid transport system permease protein